jgi:Tfp pilus assembly protein PilP
MFLMAPLAHADESSGYRYVPNSHARGDPFASPLDGPTTPLTPCAKDDELCRVDLESTKVTGLVTGRSQPIALLEDAEGHQVLVRLGSLVGQRHARVSSIKSGKVQLTEAVTDANGQPHTHLVELKLEELPTLQAD